ncbi:hypothetical protein [Comamonas aquatica]|uniref:hypothetical protein n=1 Tax=Comamonas aquatica TaxID=225991 RepID=UPI0024468D9B|nr:hypothetical protein [Comamonas aquatica]MDH0496303.1 hypothetical protein [Comamonas aquatica]MDH0901342.1 hypothetical protein [Comamonas aquatica]
MTGTPGNYVVDGPMGMFGKGQSSKSFSNGEAFYAYVDALRKLGRTVTVHADHAPVFAVVEVSKPAPVFDMSLMVYA